MCPDPLDVEPDRLRARAAVDVQLELLRRAVADPDRPGAAVALESRAAPVRGPVASRPRGRGSGARAASESRRLHQPPEERLRSLVEAEPQPGVEGPASIAEPGVAVVPVTGAADPLGEQAVGAATRAPRRREDEQLLDEARCGRRPPATALRTGSGMPRSARRRWFWRVGAPASLRPGITSGSP